MDVTKASELQRSVYLQFAANESLIIDFYWNGYRLATLIDPCGRSGLCSECNCTWPKTI